MPIYTLADLRSTAPEQLKGVSDQELIQRYASHVGMDPVQVANTLGYDNGASTLTKERISGSIDNYQSGLYETGAAVAGVLGLDGARKFAERKAADNRFQAEVAGARAKQLGGVESYEDIDGVSSGVNYLGGLAAQSLPYAAEAMIGGWVGRVGATGLKAASIAGRAAGATEEAVRAGTTAQKALNLRSMGGATVASYPSSMGDILGNQREQIEANGGDMNYGSAAVGAVPYSLLNGALGINSLAARGRLARVGTDMLDGMQGFKGGAARMGATVGKTMLEEGSSELGQEGVNQYFGRMAVDPNEEFLTDGSRKRFAESFVGGAALGGAFGTIGGHRRSEGYKPAGANVPNPDQTTTRDEGPVPQLGYSPLAGTPTVFPDGTVALNGEQELQARFPNQVEPARGLNTARVGEVSDPNIVVDRAGAAATNNDDVEALNDPGAELGRQRYLEQREQQQRLGEIKKAALARAEEIKVQEAAAKEFGIKGTKGVGLFVELNKLHEAGGITDGELTENIALLGAKHHGSVEKWIKAQAVAKQTLADSNKADQEAVMTALLKKDAKNVSATPTAGAVAAENGQQPGPVNAGSQPVSGSRPAGGAGGAGAAAAGAVGPGATSVAVRGGGGDTGAVVEKKPPVSKTVKGFDSSGKPITVDLTYVDEGRTLYSVVVNAADGTSKEVGFKPETRAPDVVRALRKNGVLYDTVSGNTATVGRVGRQKVVTKKELEKQLKGATAVELRTVKLALGLDGSWEPASYGPLSAPQISAVLAKTRMTNGELSRTSIKNTLDKFGITQDVLTQFGAHDFSADESSTDAEDYATYEDREKVLSESKVNERTLSSDERNAVDGDTGRDGVFDSVDAEDAEDEDAGYEHMDAESTSGKAGAKSGGEGGALRRAHIGLTALLKVANTEGGPEFSADHVRILENSAKTAEKALAPDDTGVQGSRLNRAQNALKQLRKTLELPIWSDDQRELLEPLIGSAKKVNSAAKVDDVVSVVANEGVVTEEQKAIAAAAKAQIAKNEALIAAMNAEVEQKQSLRDLVDGRATDADIEEFSQDWEDLMEKGDPSWGDLDVTEQAKWVLAAVKRYSVTTESSKNIKDAADESYRRQRTEIADSAIERRKYEARRNGAGTGAESVGVRTGPTGAVASRSGAPSTAAETGRQEPASGEVARGDGGAGQGTAETRSRPVTQPTVTIKKKRTVVKPDGAKFSKGEEAESSTVAQAIKEIETLGLKLNPRRVTVVQSVVDLPAGVQTSMSEEGPTGKRVRGVVINGKAYLIADNIAPGTARSVFLHEVGSHLGLDGILSQDQRDILVASIIDWADRNDGSMEFQLAQRAIDRVGNANTADEQVGSELMAYFIEEAVDAGIDPTAMQYKGELNRWFRTLWSSFKMAIRKLGWVNADKLTAQDVVDLAYGAAKLEMDGTWHGTAADFRKFDHRYMGSGEGAQAFGWGSYLAQRPGIAKGYWEADIRRKGHSAAMFDGISVEDAGKEADKAAAYPATPYSESSQSLALSYVVQALRSQIYIGSEIGDVVDDVVSELKSISRTEDYEGSTRYKDAAKWLNANKNRFADKNIDGALMRTDVNVADDEWLHWDKPLSEQSDKVRSVLENLPELGMLSSDDDEDGGRMYREIAYQKGSDKAASEYLDKLGVKGIKFLDASSRRWEGAKFKIVEAGPYRTRMEKVKPWIVDILGKDGGSQTMNFRTREEAEAWVDSAKNEATHNFVVFNDKNIYRVASLRGANRENVKFSIAPTLRDTARRVGGSTGAMLYEDAAHQAVKAVRSLAFLHDLVAEYKDKLRSPEAVKSGAPSPVQEWYKSLQATVSARMEMEEPAERIAAEALKLKAGAGKVNALVAKATIEQKWPYDPKIAGRPVTPDATLAREFNALSTDEQKIVRDIFDHGETMRQYEQDLMTRLDLGGILTAYGKLDGPYAPLVRFGNYIAILKSQKLRDAEHNGDTKKVEELKKDPANYTVSFFDTKGQAAEFARMNDKAHGGTYDFTTHGEKDVRVGEEMPTDHAVIQRVLATIKAGNLDPKAKEAAATMIRDMYFQSIDEHHARVHGLQRKNVAGYSDDMVRSFLSHARAQANFLANLEHGGETNEQFYAMKHEARRSANGTLDNQDVLNTFAAHYAESLKYKETPIQDRMMAMTSAWQLATSVGYHLANFMQPIMTTLPRLASDFNDYSGAWKHLMDGYKAVNTTGFRGHLSLDGIKDDGLRATLQRAVELQLMDMGMDSDISSFEATHTGMAPVDAASRGVKKALHNLRQVSRAVETANRVSSAVAAYNMARQKGKTEAEAQEYTINILQTTQGDSTRMGAPLLLKRLPKIMTQYKKFQFMMAAMYVKAFRQAFKGATAEERAIGRRMLAYKLFHTSMAAGVMGLPLMNLVQVMFNMLGADGDEPPDFERWLKENGAPEVLLHGPLSFMGTDAKLGEEKIFSILPYADWDITSATGVKNMVAGLAGPAVSQMLKTADGIGAIKNGDYYKGVEKMMPSGVANAMKAFRVANDGFTLKNGDVMFKPEDTNGAVLALDALGLPSSQMKNMEWLRSQQYEIGKFYNDRSKAIERDYLRAVKDGDTDAMQEARESWMSLQAGKDEMRHWFGDSAEELKRQPLSTLIKYPQTVAKREAKLQKGARVE